MFSDKVLRVAEELENRFLAVPYPLEDPTQEFLSVRAFLLLASDEGIVRSPPHDIFALLQLDRRRETEAVIMCGAALDGGREADRHLLTASAGRLTFSMTLALDGGKWQFIAYRFNLLRASGDSPSILRFDLNQAVHQDRAKEPRAHLHPGADHIRVATPIWAPMEVLATLISVS